MKKLKLFLGILSISANLFAQNIAKIDTVSVGAGYTNQVWYSLANGKVGSAPKNNWDIAFDISNLRTGAVLSNTIIGDSVFKTHCAISNWTDKMDSSTSLGIAPTFNSDTSWSHGAFNATGDFVYKYGWGTYNPATHIVVGDSVFIVKLSDGTSRKVWIINYNYGIWNFKYGKLDGTGEKTVSISRDSFPGKHFIYYSFLKDTVLDREPKQAQWDLSFGQWHGFIPDPTSGKIVPYPLTGVLADDSVKVAKAAHFDLKSNDYSKQTFLTSISAIGAGWKVFNQNTNAYTITDSLAYFVKAKNGVIWKLIFTGYGGVSNGNFVFNKTALTTNVVDVQNGTASFAVYPNPALDGQIHILYDAGHNAKSLSLQLFDISGRVMYNQSLDKTEGLHPFDLPQLNLSAGIYFVRLQLDNQLMTEKLIIR